MSAQRLTPYSTRPPPPATQKFVTCEWLSINRGSTTLVGIPGKLYHRGDRVQCIIDSMYGLVYQQQLRSLSALYRPPEEADPGVLAAPHEHNPLAVCKQCGTTDRNDLQLSTDGDAMVCNKCGAVGGQLTVSQHREKNCAEDEDKTKHAERPRDVSADPFDKPAPTATEARREREREAQGVVYSRKAKEKRGLGWAPEAVARWTAQAARDRKTMHPKDQTKEIQIIHRLDELFVTLEPMDAAVKRYCRVQGWRTWQNAVRHAACCKQAGGECHFNVYTKGFPVIAESVLVTALQNLAHGVDTLEEVAHSHVVALNNKLAARVNSASATAAQRAVRQQVARLMMHDNLEAPLPPCVPCSPGASQASESIAPSPAGSAVADRTTGVLPPAEAASEPPVNSTKALLRSLQRAGLDDTGADGPAAGADDAADDAADPEYSSSILRLRDCIDRLRVVLSSTPAPVMHATMAVVASNVSMNLLCAAYARDARLQQLNLQAFAYVILETVARRIERATGAASEAGTRMRPRLLQSIGTTAEQVEGAVAAAEAVLPSGAVDVRRNADEDEDDGLF